MDPFVLLANVFSIKSIVDGLRVTQVEIAKKYDNVKIINAMIENEKKISCIVRIVQLEPTNISRSGTSYRKLIVKDSQGVSIDLMLWDQQPFKIDENEIKENDVIGLRGANMRIDNKGKRILNAGMYARIENVSNIFDARKF